MLLEMKTTFTLADSTGGFGEVKSLFILFLELSGVYIVREHASYP
jgi:hypothetical protein